MGCEVIRTPGGGTAIICSRGQRARKCKACGRRNATLLCDWPKPGAPPCKTCRSRRASETDFAACEDCGDTGVETCSTPVCESCRRVAAEGDRRLDVCPACGPRAFRDDRRPVMRDTAECDGCPSRVLWALNATTGKPAPLAAPPEGSTGNVRVWFALGRWRYEALGKAAADAAREAGERLYLNHFADCVNAARFRRG